MTALMTLEFLIIYVNVDTYYLTYPKKQLTSFLIASLWLNTYVHTSLLNTNGYLTQHYPHRWLCVSKFAAPLRS